NLVRTKNGPPDFSMDVRPLTDEVGPVLAVAMSPTIIGFYGPVLFVAIALAVILPREVAWLPPPMKIKAHHASSSATAAIARSIAIASLSSRRGFEWWAPIGLPTAAESID